MALSVTKGELAKILHCSQDAIEDFFPCSAMQEGFIAVTSRGSKAPIRHIILEMASEVDLARFKIAVEKIVNLSDIMRARIVDTDSLGLIQVVQVTPVEWKDYEELSKCLESANAYIWNLGDPLARYAIVEDRRANRRWFVWTVHHAIYDGWSFSNMASYVTSAYLGEDEVRIPRFKDFITRMRSNSTEAAESYWRGELKDLNSIQYPALPTTDYKPIAISTCSHRCPPIPKIEGISRTTLLRIALAIVLAKHTGANDVCFGTVLSGRSELVQNIATMMGCTISTVPLRLDLAGLTVITDLLKYAMKKAQEMPAFEHWGLRNISRMNEDGRVASEFQTLLIVQRSKKTMVVDSPVGKWRRQEADHGASSQALTIQCCLEDDGIDMEAWFDSQIIEEWKARRILLQVSQVTQQLANHQNQLLSDIKVVVEEDLRDIWQWNAIVPSAIDTCIHDLIASTARQRPDAPAIDAWDGELTYGELEILSTQLAMELTHHGAEGQVVPLLFEKSLWTPVAMLAVMKAGAASLALDTSQPPERLVSMIQQVHPRIVLSSRLNEQLALQLHDGLVLIADSESIKKASSPQVELSRTSPSSPLYIQFTSGSTGTPKGVIVSHSNFSTLVESGRGRQLFAEDDRVVDFASYAFDVAWSNLVNTLTVGACLCIPSEDQRRHDLGQSIRDLRGTYIHLTPTVAKTVDPSTVPSLRKLNLGGEPVAIEEFQHWRNTVEIIVTYGPAECTVTTTCANVADGEGGIGHTIASNAWIVHEGQLCPVGAVGELWLEGPLVGQGYIHDNERTQRAFVQDPPWLVQGSSISPPNGRRGRLYRTGDLMKYTADGSLVFIGRKDDQVKIRGQRVELGEVEHHVRNALEEALSDDSRQGERANNMTITSVNVIAEAVLLNGSTRSLLVAFINIVGSDTHKSWSNEHHDSIVRALSNDLNHRLSARIPAYMIPSVYLPQHDQVVSATGKSDRRKLREMLEKMSLQQVIDKFCLSTSEVVLPQNHLESQLVELWGKILVRDARQISINSHFFQIGGDSIDAMRLVSMARKSGLFFSAMDVFRYPRLCDLARIAIAVEAPVNLEVPAYSLLPAYTDSVRANAAMLCKIIPEQIEDILPCTPLQEGLLALTARRHGDYITTFSYAVHKDICLSHLKKSWEVAIAATAILRTRVVFVPGLGLSQVVLKYDESMTLTDSANQARPPLLPLGTLGQPLWSVTLLTDELLGTRSVQLEIHHALYDGWCLPKIIQIVERSYDGYTLPNLTPFAAFVKYVKEIDEDQARQYWNKQFSGFDAQRFPPLPSPSYHPQPSHIYRQEIICPTRRAKLSLSTAIRSTWAILSARESGSDEAIFGAVVSGRQAEVPGIEEIVGPTLAVVPIRILLSSEMTIEELLQQVQQQAIDMIRYEQTGLQNIRRVSREAELACTFQSLIVVHPKLNFSTSHPMLKLNVDVESNSEAIELGGYGTHSLALDCFLQEHGMMLQVTFDPAVIGEAQVKRLTQRFELVLQQMCSEDHRASPLRNINVTLDQDLDDIWRWNARVPQYVGGCMHDIISATIKRRPSACAADAWDGAWTYSELDALSTKLALELINTYAVGPEVIVPLVFEKSKWTPVAMLAVMKAGGASVALDISQPLERLSTIVQQAKNPRILLSSTLNRTIAQRIYDGPVLVVGQTLLESFKDTANAGEYWPQVDPNNALYIVFTSGSTGTPKGVVITHGNFATAVQECYAKDVLHFTEEHRIFDFASYAFDVSWSNMLNAFAAGATLCIPSEDDRRGDIGLAISKFGATYVDLTPTVARLLQPSSVPSLRVLNIGGEFVCFGDFHHWFDNAEVLVTYGPTEVTVCTTCLPINHSTPESEGIGHSFGTNAWIVDANENDLCPVGAIGELWLEGPFVGRGYLNNHEKTQAAFVDDPPWLLKGGPNHPGRRGRLYKTGDLVQYNQNGGLIFIGRKDHQVKIRGQRIELGEVEHHVQTALKKITGDGTSGSESAYRDHVMVEAVTLKGSTQPSLIAFINLRRASETPWTGSEHDLTVRHFVENIKRQLALQVPVYMIPTAFLPIHDLAITTTGKKDRKELRELAASLTLEEITESHLSPDRQQPSTPEEVKLAALWAEVLGRDETHISAEDDFFQLGGNSIDAMKIASAARRHGLTISVADIFLNPQLSDLAQAMKKNIIPPATSPVPESFSLLKTVRSRKDVKTKASSLCDVPLMEIEDILPCTPLQKGLLSLTARRGGDYIASFVYELNDHVNLVQFEEAWNKVVANFAILRTRIINLAEEGLVQVVLRENSILTSSESPATGESKLSDLGPEVLGKPLSKAAILTNSNGEKQFVWKIHHALYDGLSLSKVFEALEHAYKGKPLQEITPFSAFLQYIAAIEGSMSYWKAQFDGLNAQQYPRLTIPDYNPQATQVSRRRIALPSVVSKSHFTLSTILRATWAILVASNNESNEAVFGAVVSGRQVASLPGIEDMVGPTLATVPLRIIPDPTISVKEFLERVQNQAIQMIPFEQTGLQQIRKFSEETEEACNFQSLLTVQPTEKFNSGQELFKMDQHPTEESIAANASAFGSYSIVIDCYLQEKDAIELHIAVDPFVVQEEEVQRIFERFDSVLGQVCAGEHDMAHLSTIRTISAQDLDTIWRWNATIAPSMDVCVHDLISMTVKRRHHAPAICAWNGELTYGKLDELSTRLAAHLVRHGVGPETVVPLVFEKGMWTPVAILAVMKAGGASVLLDVMQPLDRLRSLMRQVKPIILLTSRANAQLSQDLFPEGPILVAEHAALEDLDGNIAFNGPTVKPSNALYVVFTSGTTGTPKGVVITHGNFSTAVHEGQQALMLTENARILDFASYAFDVAWSNVINALTIGALLCIPAENERNDPSLCIANYGATWVELTPTVAKLVQPSSVPTLKVINLSGEAVHVEEFQDWMQTTQLIVTYGPSECTVTTTCAKAVLKAQDTPEIGHTIGSCAWIVSKDDLCPVGAVGELWLEGPLVGRGYLGNTEQMERSFVEDPAWLLKGNGPDYPGRHGRLYRTGDLVRYSPNTEGGLIFLGRKDNQVKIRGQRVELDEVAHYVQCMLMEAAEELRTQSSNGHTFTATNKAAVGATPVRISQIHVAAEAVVLSESRRPSLIAFITLISQDNKKWDQDEHILMVKQLVEGLEHKILGQVPAYMVPAAYVPLSNAMIAATGKTDRRRLRETVAGLTLEQLTTRYQSRHYLAPQSEVEIRLAELWSQILDLKNASISVNDHFFYIGGDSIDAMRLVSIARERGLHLDVPTMFKKPRLGDMASSVALVTNTADMEVRPFSLLRDTAGINKTRAVVASYCGVPAEQIEDILPCTPLQQGLIALSERRPGDYVAEFSYKLREDVDVSRFKRAWNNTMTAIPILRTRVLSFLNEGVVQVVLKEEVSFQTSDLQGDVFRLGCPLQTTALRKDSQNGSKQFVLRLHHALYDGWSLPKIFETLTTAYGGGLSIQSARFPFSKFVRHITNVEEGPRSQYWRDQFEGLDVQQFPHLPFPNYHPQPKQLYQCNTGFFPPVHTEFTLSTAVRAAWAIVLAKYSDSTEALFGAVVSGRQNSLPGIEMIVGPTIATVPVRISLEKGQSVEALLDQIQLQSAQMVQFEQTGLQNIRRVSREASHACEFQSLVVVQPKENVKTGNGLFEMTPDSEIHNEHAISSIEGFGTFSVMLDVLVSKQGLQLRIAFDPVVMTEQQIRRISRQFELILRQVCSEEHRKTPIGKVKTVTDQDLDDIWRWNKDLPPAVDECVHDRIAETFQLYQHSTKTAIDAWDGVLTYNELDELSTQVATELAHRGVGPGVMVPLLFEKSMWMSVAMLAVMKTGGVGIGLDTTQPVERLDSVISQIDARVILASRKHQDLSKQVHEASVFLVDRDTLKATNQNGKFERPQVKPTDDICVVFTSGSTGKPKGVPLTHRNFATAIDCHRSVFNLSNTSRIYDFASYSFDFAWSNLLLTLFSGACLCVPSEHERRDDPVASMAQFQATFGFFTPALVQTFRPELLPSLQTLLVGGEKFRAQDLPSFDHSCQVWLVYGPTESTVLATSARLHDVQDEQYTIGRGMATNTWIVSNDELCAIGSVGELWLEGPLVGRGYLNNAEKSHEVFVDDPGWLIKGGPSQAGRRGKLYKTGDLVRYDSDGAIIFVGRKDNQVKVRGQRVELREVDHHVTSALKEAIMQPTLVKNTHVDRKDSARNSADNSSDSGDDVQAASNPNTLRNEICVVSEVVTFSMSISPRLVSFISLDRSSSHSTVAEHDEAVRRLTRGVEERLATKVPMYMCPSEFIAIYDMPMTITGKFDRKRLREIAAGISLSQIRSPDTKFSRSLTYPATATELKLEALWKNTLNISDDIDIDADFFRTGGDSITAMQVSAAAKGLGLSITAADIVKYKTIGKIAAACRPLRKVSSRKAKTEDSVGIPFPLTPIQQWFVAEHPEGNICFDICFHLELANKVTAEALQQAFSKLVARHSMLRARFQKHSSGIWTQRVTDELDSSFMLTSVSNCEDSALSSALTKCRDSINIELGPMVSAVHVENSDKQFLFLAINHLVSDLVSFRVIFQDLEDILLGSELRPINSLDFQRWASIQEEAAKSLDPSKALNVNLEKERFDYWGLEATDIGKSTYIHRKFVLNPSITSAILGWVNDVNKSEPMELMIAALMHAYGSVFQDRTLPAVFSEGHGRESLNDTADVSQTVGWFTTMYPIQLQCDESIDLRHMIKHTTQTIRNIPRKGWDYFASRYLNEDGKKMFACNGMEINFNYLGIFQQLERSTGLFRRVPVPPNNDPPSAKKVKGLAIFEVTSVVRQRQLEFDFLIDDRVKNIQGVDRWIEMVQMALLQMVEDAHGSRISAATEGLREDCASERGFEHTIRIEA